jgi:Ca2+-transporting ATPase
MAPDRRARDPHGGSSEPGTSVTAQVTSTGTGGVAWHSLSAEEALARVGATADGLSGNEAHARLGRYGPNQLAVTPPEAAWRILVRQFRSVVVVLLVTAVVFALASGDRPDAIAVSAVLLVNIVIGFATEVRARRAVEALLVLDVPRAAAFRDGEVTEVDAAMLVPGDVIWLEEGRAVPADARVIAGNELRTVEAALTGESLPSTKNSAAQISADTPLADRATMVYKGTTIAAGSARAVVVATGGATQIGHVGALVGAVPEERTQFERRLDALGTRLALGAIMVGVLIGGLALTRGASAGEVFLLVIAVAVAAVPEGLPAVVTVTMAVGVRRMARRHAIIRRLSMVENIGAATVVCTDKTGTLTLGQMTATNFWTADLGRWPGNGCEITVTGSGYDAQGAFLVGGAPVNVADLSGLRRSLEVGMLANRAGLVREGDGGWIPRGDPTEVALLLAGRKAGLDRDQLLLQWPETSELPFSSERMLMATHHRADEGIVAFAKGAPARLLERCDRVVTAAGEVPLDEAGRAAVLAANDSLAARGLRVLAFASGSVNGASEEQLHGLVFLGLCGMSDPPAPEVQKTIARLRDAGIRTIMLTGDQRLTAEAIARILGIAAQGEETVDGRQVDALSDEALTERVQHAGAFSRVSPEAKLRIVSALRRSGEIVAMLGDGVNDAPALKQADVGVAMGRRGSDIAKQAAGVVLADDRFATITTAVEEGRVVYANIRRFVFYLVSCNVAEILVLLAAGVAGLPVPLQPLQILWLNLLTDTFPALALAFEPADSNVMQRKPRHPGAPLLSGRLLLTAIGDSVLIAVCTLAALAWGIYESGGSLAAGMPERAATLAFMTLALAQLAQLANARRLPWERGVRPGNRHAIVALVFTLALQFAATYVSPLAAVLHVVPLGATDMGVAVGLALLPLGAGMVMRPFNRRVEGDFG